MTDGGRLDGLGVAIISAGGALARAAVMACAEAGARLALGTMTRSAAEEYAVNSMANEAWAMGREQFVRPIDSASATEMASFADEVCDRYGRAAAAIVVFVPGEAVPFTELSEGEWQSGALGPLTTAFLACQSFGRVMQRDGGGMIAFATRRRGGDAAHKAARAGIDGLVEAVGSEFRANGIDLELFSMPAKPDTELRRLMERIAAAQPSS